MSNVSGSGQNPVDPTARGADVEMQKLQKGTKGTNGVAKTTKKTDDLPPSPTKSKMGARVSSFFETFFNLSGLLDKFFSDKPSVSSEDLSTSKNLLLEDEVQERFGIDDWEPSASDKPSVSSEDSNKDLTKPRNRLLEDEIFDILDEDELKDQSKIDEGTESKNHQ